MNKEEIYTNSILTFAFTNDGQIIVRKDKEGKLDTLPWIFMGYRERKSKIDYEDDIWVMNNIDGYKERVATFFAYYLRNCRDAILNNWFVGNGNDFLDVGELHEKIADLQVKEMKEIHTPSFIRVNRSLYDGGINQNGQQVIFRIETRYIVLPRSEDIGIFPELEAKDLEELRENNDLLSNKLVFGITGEDGAIMESFVDQIKSLNSSHLPQKFIRR